jgi:hypothetical protein
MLWDLIEFSKAKADRAPKGERMDRQVDVLRRAVEKLEPAKVLRLCDEFTRLVHAAASNDRVAKAGVVLSHGVLSENNFEDFCVWLISQGRDIYRASLRQPDGLATMVDFDDVERFFFEDLYSVPFLEYFRQTGQEIGGERLDSTGWARLSWTEEDLRASVPRLIEAVSKSGRRSVPKRGRGKRGEARR